MGYQYHIRTVVNGVKLRPSTGYKNNKYAFDDYLYVDRNHKHIDRARLRRDLFPNIITENIIAVGAKKLGSNGLCQITYNPSDFMINGKYDSNYRVLRYIWIRKNPNKIGRTIKAIVTYIYDVNKHTYNKFAYVYDIHTTSDSTFYRDTINYMPASSIECYALKPDYYTFHDMFSYSCNYTEPMSMFTELNVPYDV